MDDGNRSYPTSDHLRSLVVASRIESALAHRTWSITPATGNQRCSVFLVEHGHAVLSMPDETEVELSAPAVVWLPPGTACDFRLLAGGDGAVFSASQEFAWRTIGDSPVGMQLRRLLTRTLVAPSEHVSNHIAELAISFDVMIRESRAQQSGASAMMSAHMALILLHLWRASGEADRAQAPRGARALTVQRFRQLVELHYREHLTIDDYAAILGVTRSHLHDACVRLGKRTPLAIVHERLIDEARLRLEQTALSVEQIGYGLGFRDPGYFNRFFRRATGQSPGMFRQMVPAGPKTHPSQSYAAWP